MQNFLKSVLNAQKPADIYKAALEFQNDMLFMSGGFSDALNRSKGIDVPPAFNSEVYFERGDLCKLAQLIQSVVQLLIIMLIKFPQTYSTIHDSKTFR